MVEVGELELIKIKYNTHPYIVPIKMVTTHIFTSAVLDYIDNLPGLYVIHSCNILDNDICLPT